MHAFAEPTLHSGPASLWRSVEPVTGTLTLTNERLVFEPSAFLIRGGSVTIALRDVAKVELGNSLLVFPNQLVIATRLGQRHKFVVANREEWLAKINALTSRAR